VGPKNVKGVWRNLSNCVVRDAEWTPDRSQCCDSDGVFLRPPIEPVQLPLLDRRLAGRARRFAARLELRHRRGGRFAAHLEFPIDHSGPVSLCRPTKFLGVPGLKSGGSPRKNLPLSRPTPVRTADRPRFRARNAGRGVAGPEGAGVRFARLENCKFTCGSACRYTAARQVPRAMDGLPVEPCARRK
jgi:hypothetical protein